MRICVSDTLEWMAVCLGLCFMLVGGLAASLTSSTY